MLMFLLMLIDASAGTPPKIAAHQSDNVWEDAYPVEAFRLRQEGSTMLTVHVSVKGKVVGCLIAQSSGSPSLDQATCAFARRFRFDPARDASGQPIEGDAPFPMHWKLPH